MRLRKIHIIILLFFFTILIGLSISASAQNETEDPAEVVAYINEPTNRIPPVKVSEETTINVTVVDAFGIPWGKLSTNMPILAKYVWPIIHPNWKPFLGFTSLNFETEIVKGDGRGWFTRVEPSSIANADQGRFYNLTLYAKTDDISVDYAVVIGIRVTRKDTAGNEFGESYIYVPVKSSQLNNVRMNIQDTSKEAAPKSYVTFEGEISNFGYYRGMFELEFEHNDDLTVSSPNQVTVLESGETKKVSVQVLTAEKLFDVGTPYEIRVLVRSSGDPEPIHVGTLRVISKGIYISPLAFIILIPIIVALAIILFVFLFFKNKRDRELYGKPNKPWLIPAEKQYLQELKEKDSEKYQEVLDMMKKEYQSALLWWQDTQQREGQQFSVTDIFSRLKNTFKKTEKSSKKDISEKREKKKESIGETSEKKSKESKESKEENKSGEKPSKEPEKSKEVIKEEPEKKTKSEEKTSKKPRKKISEKSEESFNVKEKLTGVSDKLSSGFKKWFTVPEEEKRKQAEKSEEKEEFVTKNKREKKEEPVDKPRKQKKSKQKDDYDQELERIERKHKQKQMIREQEQKKNEKQKSMKKVRRAQERQRQKLNR